MKVVQRNGHWRGTEESQKTLPRMLLIGVCGVTVFYILFNIAIYRVIPVEEARS